MGTSHQAAIDTLHLFLNAWHEQDWDMMALATQMTWRTTVDHPATELERMYKNRVLGSYEVVRSIDQDLRITGQGEDNRQTVLVPAVEFHLPIREKSTSLMVVCSSCHCGRRRRR